MKLAKLSTLSLEADPDAFLKDIIYMTYCPETDTESSDRAALEVEKVTPDMMAAGLKAFREFDPSAEEADNLIFAIIRRAFEIAARNRSCG